MYNKMLDQFYRGINWNAFSFVSHKIASMVISFVLFSCMTTQDFSTWVNINSVIFLILLWLDLGLRKSLPRFCVEFSQNTSVHRRFVSTVLSAQIALIGVSSPLFFYIMTILATKLHLSTNVVITGYATYIFLTEGIISILRLLYHAHSHQKAFNTAQSWAIALDMLMVIIALAVTTPSAKLLIILLAAKAFSNTLLVIYCIAKSNTIFTTSHPTNQPIDPQRYKDFIVHSGSMWFNTTIKSLSERNFIIPFLTYTFGQEQSNIAKIAIEGSLVFYRALLKTIGTTDTTLLTHTIHNPSLSLSKALQHLTTTIFLLSIPFLGLAITSIRIIPVTTNPIAMQLFSIITLGYFIEALLSPFERVLEVNEHHTTLLKAYIPYILIILVFFISNLSLEIGLISFIMCVQGARLTGSFLMVHGARKKYLLPLPYDTIKIHDAYANWKNYKTQQFIK